MIRETDKCKITRKGKYQHSTDWTWTFTAATTRHAARLRAMARKFGFTSVSGSAFRCTVQGSVTRFNAFCDTLYGETGVKVRARQG